MGATEVPFLAHIDLRLDPTFADRLPFPLALEPNTFTANPSKECIWLGPDEWLLIGHPGTAPDILAELEAALHGAHRSVVDVSANRATLDLTGPDVFDLLSKGCGLDLHPRSWTRGMCAQTLLAHAPVILQQRDETTRIFLRPSFADYLMDWLIDAADEYRAS